ncbi:MAG: Tn3 family transposase [Xenococcaceae cyanobacterium MO_234.B1]|nr:Tn3 family transposase [Xenococcaceae cyanobacterium MO_234.B1]
MKQNWELDELIENWTLLPQELSWLSNKSGANLLTTALLLKWFQYETKFPNFAREIPDSVIDYLARQLKVSAELISEYNWQGRSYKRHCAEVRQFLGIRKAKVKDAQDLITWLIANVLDKEVDLEHLKEIANQRFWSLKIQPPPPNRVERLVRSALHTYETNFFQQTLDKLSPQCLTQIDALLITSEGDETDNTKEKTTFKASKFHFLNSEPGRVSLNSLLTEIAKLQTLRQIGLPKNLFRTVTPKVLQAYSTRAGIEYPSHLRSHPEPTRYTLMAAFCHLRTLDVTDNLVDLLIQMIHGIGKRAERKVNTQLMRDFKKVRGKHGILFQMANASLEQPEGKIQEVIYPVVSQQTLQDLVKELKASGTAYRQKIHTVVRSSYRHHYRRILPKLLSLLEFRSNNDIHQPVIEALKLLKKYANSKQRYYDSEEKVPIEGVLKKSWQEILIETDTDGNERINRINYEICVLQALRERLRCKEIWVEGSNRYRNPEEDLPADFEQQREVYYQALGQPTNVEEFIKPLKQAMDIALKTLNDGLPKNSKVEILQKYKGSIRLSPLEKQPEPVNLLKLKSELSKRWSMTSLLDILKEADLRIGFTDNFKSLATREALDRETIQKRLLLCLYGLGTNTGLMRISNGTPKVNHHDLRYIKRRFVHKEALRQAITQVANAIFQIRLPQIWGEGTTTCASDSKKFGAWDQNLMTEWHVEKNSTCIYSQLKTCSSSEVAAMIEGVLRHDTEMTVKKNFVDSHGQSEVAFAFCHLLGFQLMPRLKAIKRQKLYRPEAGNSDAYPKLQAVLSRTINWDLIRQQYDQIIKYTTALRLGTAEPEAILRRFTRANVQHPTYQALGELGKVLKTIFLCQYLHSEALRREIHEGLNVVENWNSANSFIFYGRSSEFASNQGSEQVLSMLSLHLLQVCLVYVNTLMLQSVLSESHWSSQMTTEDKRALNPLIYGHVNPYGIFPLDMNKRLKIEQQVA